MNLTKVTNEAGEMWRSFKKKDPVMVKKTFSMKDVMYRKSSPGKEIWHTEVSFDYDFYLLVLALIAVTAAACVIMCKMTRGMSSFFCFSRKRKGE